MSTIESRRELLRGIAFDDIKEGAAHAELWFDTYLPKQERKSDEAQPQDVEQEKKRSVRADHVKELCNLKVPELYDKWYERWEAVLRGCGAKTRHAEAISRISVGLGEESVLETSVALHHTYGVPYIAGSALKGLVASYIRQKLLPLDPSDDSVGQWQQAYMIICGDQKSTGYLTFFDAMYIPKSSEQPLVPDVITVHHQKYYQGTNDAPADWDSPIPVPFPSAGGHYLIALSAPDLPQSIAWINTTFDILEAALKTLGIGAKTSSGYGRMRYVPEEDDDDVQEQKPQITAEVQALIDEIANFPVYQVNGQMQKFHLRWQSFKDEVDRRLIAQAIIDRVRETGYEGKKIDKAWYQDLAQFLQKYQD